MKRLSLTIILAITLSASMAESGVGQPLLQEGKVWTYDYQYVDIHFNFLSGTAEWKVEGDTLVGTKRMFRMSFSNTEGSTFRQLWHEEGGKVYAYNEERETSALVYDFTLAAGEKVPRHPDGYLFYDGFVVASTDSVLVHGALRKRLFIQNAETGEKVTWVEGIGNPMLLSEPIAHTVSDGRSYSLVSCSLDGEAVFAKEDFQAPAYKTSTNRVDEQILVDDAPCDPGVTYDIQGRRVSGTCGTLRPGVYIRNGRKFVAR